MDGADDDRIDGVANDNTTLTEVLEHYAGAGFDGSFGVLDGDTVECARCSARLAAGELSMTSLRRLEGASEPDEMMAVVALTCPSCGNRGTLVLGYGPAASGEDSDVLRQLRDARGDEELPSSIAPGEGSADDGPG